MRNDLKHELVSQFKSQVPSVLPRWQPAKSKYKNEPIFFCSLEGSSFGFIKLQPDESYNAFTIDVSWNLTPEYPWDPKHLCLAPFDIPEKNYKTTRKPGQVISSRIGSFLPTKQDTWWNVVTGTTGVNDDQPKRLNGRQLDGNKIQECVTLAIALISQYVQPKLDEIAAEYSASLAKSAGPLDHAKRNTPEFVEPTSDLSKTNHPNNDANAVKKRKSVENALPGNAKPKRRAK